MKELSTEITAVVFAKKAKIITSIYCCLAIRHVAALNLWRSGMVDAQMPRYPFTPDYIVHPWEIVHEYRESGHLGPAGGKILRNITEDETGVTADIAETLERVTGRPARLWLEYQRLYDEGIV